MSCRRGFKSTQDELPVPPDPVAFLAPTAFFDVNQNPRGGTPPFAPAKPPACLSSETVGYRFCETWRTLSPRLLGHQIKGNSTSADRRVAEALIG